jgi:hypothetical protein
MAEKTTEKSEAGKSGNIEIRFRCRLCQRERPLQEMRTVTRFVPVLIVCRDCAKTLR